ncbi:polyprenyl synthetase family protein [Streptomyces canus]|uniref:polyprenyl synthetase family protein n=1 Tax=Streptomyces canus TaxID=58343 RepID=UPI003CF18D45
MRPTHAKDHPATAPPRLVAVAEASVAASCASEACAAEACEVEASVAALPRLPAADDGAGPGTARPWHPASGAPSAWGPREVREVDADVPGAVGRMLDHVLAERLRRARLADGLFAEELAERVTRFTLRGGKRTRARLVWWASRACAGRDPAAAAAALRVGAALELLQTCALVHDDVMDRASLRRGRPALHAEVAAHHAGRVGRERAERFGQSAAILAGDLALAWADDLVAQTPMADWASVVVRRLWSDMRTEMVAGQYLDVQSQVTAARSLPRALRAACLKSALYSVERPLALGAAVAGANDATLRRLCDAGRCVGMAFQLRDDLDDVFGDPRETGKACGGDIREGKATYLVAVARARAEAAGDRAALAVLDRRLGDASLTEDGLAEVREVLVATGARATVEAKIDRLAAQGLRHFDGALLDPEGGGELRRLLLAAAGARPGADTTARLRPVSGPCAPRPGGAEGAGR